MKIGMSRGDEISKIYNCGFDYVEGALNAFDNKPADEMAAFEKEVMDNNIPMYSMCCFFPWDMVIVGPDSDIDKIIQYINRMVHILKKFKVEYVVIGCGGARNPYGDMTVQDARNDFKRVVIEAAKAIKSCGTYIVIEPLSYKETKILNTVKETAEFVREIRAMGYDNVYLLADFHHMCNNGEDINDLDEVSDILRHVHYAVEGSRTVAVTDEEKEVFLEQIAKLKEIGYEGNVSYEGNYIPCDELDAYLETFAAFAKWAKEAVK